MESFRGEGSGPAAVWKVGQSRDPWSSQFQIGVTHTLPGGTGSGWRQQEQRGVTVSVRSVAASRWRSSGGDGLQRGVGTEPRSELLNRFQIKTLLMA